jgi:hypothetical protein
MTGNEITRSVRSATGRRILAVIIIEQSRKGTCQRCNYLKRKHSGAVLKKSIQEGIFETHGPTTAPEAAYNISV